jgi:hypothetical protein
LLHAVVPQEYARVRLETKRFYDSLVENQWCFPCEPNGAFWRVPSEALIKMMGFAISPPFNLPWNALDVDIKLGRCWNHLKDRAWVKRGIAEIKKAGPPFKTEKDLYGPQFNFPGAVPVELHFKGTQRGKNAEKSRKSIGEPVRDNPMLEHARRRAAAEGYGATLVRSSPAPVKATQKQPAVKATQKQPAVKATQKPPAVKATKRKLGQDDIPQHHHRFKVGEHVHIHSKGVLAACRIEDLEPYVSLPTGMLDDDSPPFNYHRVHLLSVMEMARGDRTSSAPKPITFAPGDFFAWDKTLKSPAFSDVPLEEEERQLHRYFDKGTKGRDLIIWEKYLQHIPDPPAKKSKTSAKASSSSSSSSKKPTAPPADRVTRAARKAN